MWIRDKAYRKGYSLSDCDLVPRDSTYFIDPANRPDPVFCETEKDIFKALDLDYIPPEERANIKEDKEVLQSSD